MSLTKRKLWPPSRWGTNRSMNPSPVRSPAAIVVAVGTPLVNVFAAVVLTVYGPDGNGGWQHAFKAMARNPVILSIAAGLAINLTGLGLPPVADDALAILSRGTLAMALLSVGAGLHFRAARKAGSRCNCDRPSAACTSVLLNLWPTAATS